MVAIDRLLVRLLAAAPGRWVVKGGYANQVRRPDDARFTEDLDLRIDAAVETAPELLAWRQVIRVREVPGHLGNDPASGPIS